MSISLKLIDGGGAKWQKPNGVYNHRIDGVVQ